MITASSEAEESHRAVGSAVSIGNGRGVGECAAQDAQEEETARTTHWYAFE